MAKKKKIPEKYQVWIDVRKRYCLSHVHIQMARELGMNPRKFGKIANHKQEPWKAPLPIFIEDLYKKCLLNTTQLAGWMKTGSPKARKHDIRWA